MIIINLLKSSWNMLCKLHLCILITLSCELIFWWTNANWSIHCTITWYVGISWTPDVSVNRNIFSFNLTFESNFTSFSQLNMPGKSCINNVGYFLIFFYRYPIWCLLHLKLMFFIFISIYILLLEEIRIFITL